VTADSRRRYQRAERELSAAFAVLLAPALADRHAIPHLAAARRVVDSLERPNDGPAASPSTADLESLGRDDLVANVRALAARLRGADAGPSDPGMRAVMRTRWLVRAAAVVGLVVVIAGYALLTRQTARRPWRGLYYSSSDFSGDPIVRADEDVYFDWNKRTPVRGMRRNRFTVRWDSCLALSSATQIQFWLSANDGARLSVDGEVVLDNWHAESWESAPLELSRGIHHLLVEFYDHRGAAHVQLTAALGEGARGQLPPELLSYPRAEIEAPHPCGKTGRSQRRQETDE
jgi:hypothetical protein